MATQKQIEAKLKELSNGWRVEHLHARSYNGFTLQAFNSNGIPVRNAFKITHAPAENRNWAWLNCEPQIKVLKELPPVAECDNITNGLQINLR